MSARKSRKAAEPEQIILAAQDRAAGLPAWPRTACRAWSAGSGWAAVASRPRSQRLMLG